MTTIGFVVGAIGAGLIVLHWSPRIVYRLLQRHPAIREARSEYERRRADEEETLEIADWFGKTGLGEDVERELPRYLRREFGEFLGDPGALRAADLHYLGVHDEAPDKVHYWKIGTLDEATYAYVQRSVDGQISMGWGNRAPGVGLLV
jgi:hypothetical protein